MSGEDRRKQAPSPGGEARPAIFERILPEAVLETMGDGIAIHDTGFRILYQNESLRRIVGDLVGERCHRAYHAREEVCPDCHLAQAFRDGGTHRREQELATAQGRRILEMTASPLRDASGTIIAGVEIIRDVTEQRRAAEAQRSNEARLEKAQQLAHIGDWEWEVASNRVRWSDELFRIYGYAPGEVEPDYQLVLDAMHPESRDAFSAAIADALAGVRPLDMEYRFFRRDGTVAVLHTVGKVLREESGAPREVVGIVQDISSQKEGEERLRRSEEFVRTILDSVDEGFIVVDRERRILIANSAYCAQVGRRGAEVLGRRCHELTHNSSRPCHELGEDCPVQRVLETGAAATAVHRHTDERGGLLYAETKAFPIRDASGGIDSVIETVTNITEKHLLEEERLKTQKLEAIGTLAGGIAHDFNNLLQGVFGYISLARAHLEHPERALPLLAQAEEALQLSVNLTTQLLTFSKGGSPAKRRISLRAVVENAARFALSGSRAAASFTFDEDLRAVEADAGQIGQVIQNIVLNANHAMSEGGTVEIEVRNHRPPRGEPREGGAPGEAVAISIRDTGTGIPGRHLSRIFDPYFTTKEKGSGLGLATSYSIVRNHGGTIDVESRPGEGTTFTVLLPAVESGPAEEPKAAVVRPGTPGKILVMDDEGVVLEIAAEMLRSLGHEAELAEHGGAAVEKFLAARELGRPFDAVILDLTVRGGMGGGETLERLRQIDPEVKAVVSSGYSEDGIMAEFRRHGFSARLCKPYTLRELRRAVDALLV